MSNETKKFAGLESLQAFLDGCKTIFASITHKHTMSDITDYTVDSELSSTSTNPVQNAVLTAELDAIKENKSDWNENDPSSTKYIENRTHWVEQGKEVLLEELNVSNWNILNDYNQDIENIHINIGSEYIVTVDGVQYRCVGYEGYTGEWCLGDERVSGASEFTDDYHSEDVPFFIGSYENQIDAPVGMPIFYCEWYVCFPDSESHALRIEKESDEVTYHQLDENFIPDSVARTADIASTYALKSDIENIDLSEYETKEDAQVKYDTITDAKADWNQNDENAIDFIKNRTHWVESSVTVIYDEMRGDRDINYIPAAGGETFIVTVDGVSYRCVSWNMYGETNIGDSRLLGEESFGAEYHPENVPFLLNCYVEFNEDTWEETVSWYTYFATEGNHTLKIELEDPNETTYHTLSENYIPDSIARVSDVQSMINEIKTGEILTKMNKENPSGTGSFSMNRKAGTTTGNYSVAIGRNTIASGAESHAEGYNTESSGNRSHAEGESTKASGYASHAEGQAASAEGNYSHAEGISSKATGTPSHAEGQDTTASGGYGSHAEGWGTTASKNSSHAEGRYSKASGNYSHAEGNETTASGQASHSEGELTTASGNYSHAEGYYAIATGTAQHAQGRYNIEDTENKYAHIVGNGDHSTRRRNAHTLDWEGNAWYAGTIKVGGTSYDDASEVALKSDLESIDLSSYETTTNAQTKYDNAIAHSDENLETAKSYTDTSISDKADKTYVDSTFALKSDIENIDLSAYETKEDAQTKYDTITEAKADWNQNDETALDYVKNRTHWVEEGSELICQEQTIDGGTWCTLAGMEEVSLQSNLIVTFDGVKYKCESWLNNDNMICFGNGAIAGGSYSNHEENSPFLITWWLDDGGGLGFVEETNMWDVITSGDSTHTIKIEIPLDELTYHTLDERFIPDTIARKSDMDNHARIHYVTCNTAMGLMNKYVYIKDFQLVVGTVLVVKFIEGNMSDNFQLEVGMTGSKPVYYYGTTPYSWSFPANTVKMFVYDGSGWMVDYDRADSIKAYVDSNFAKKSDVQDVDLSNYYTKPEIDNLELITVDDIDAICGGSIQYAEEVLF